MTPFFRVAGFILLLGFVASIPLRAQTTELISEGFEDPIGAWTIGVERTVTHGITGSQAHSGNDSFVVGTSTCTADCFGSNEHAVRLTYTFDHEVIINKVSLWALETNTGTSNFGQAGWIEINGAPVDDTVFDPHTQVGKDIWNLYEFDVAQRATSFSIYVRDITTSGAIFLDDVKVEGVDGSVRPFIGSIAADDGLSTQIDLGFGMQSGATDGFDAGYDTFAPPSPPSGFFAALEFRGESFLTDIRGIQSDNAKWTVTFTGDPVTFTWSGLPVEGNLTLQDQFGGLFVNVDMRSSNTVTLGPGNALTKLDIIFSLDAEVGVSVNSGWNLVGLPVKPASANALTLFPDAIANTLFRFAGAYESVPNDEMSVGEGYWLRIGADRSYTLTGRSVRRVERSLSEGWNIISGPNCTFDFDSVQGEPAIVIGGTLFRFSGAYEVPEGNLLQPGTGYWVRTSSAGTLVFDCDAALSKRGGSVALHNDRASAEASLESMGYAALSFTTATGEEGVLHVGGELGSGLDRRAFSLPPVSPASSFDVRFDGGYTIPDRSGMDVAELSYAIFPVTVGLDSSSKSVIRLETMQTDGSWHALGDLSAGQSIVLSDSRMRQVRVVDVDASDIAAESELPSEFAIETTYPNPIASRAVIIIGLSEAGKVNIAVFDMLGRRILTPIHDRTFEAGRHHLDVDVSGLTSGSYIIRMEKGERTSIQHVVVVR